MGHLGRPGAQSTRGTPYPERVLLALFLLVVVLFVVLPLAGAAVGAVISAAIAGLVIGGLGRLVVPGRQRIGLLATILLGLVGSVGGGLLGHAIGVGGVATLLLEIGIAAALVALVSGGGRLGAGRPRRPLPR